MNIVNSTAERLLNRLTDLGIPFTRTPFNQQVLTCADVAKITKLREQAIGKAMVVSTGKHYAIALLPSSNKLNVKAVQALLKADKAFLPNKDQVKEAIGLDVGAITPLIALEKKDLLVVGDESLLDNKEINISSGDLTFGITLHPGELFGVLNVIKGHISK